MLFFYYKILKKIVFCSTIICGISNLVNAQNYVELLKVQAGTTPLNKFDSSSVSSVLNEFLVDATVPIKLNSKSTFITGIICENIQTKLFEDQKIQSFSSINLKLGVSHKFNDKFTSTFILLPKVASNFGRLTEKDFQMGAVALFKYKTKPNLHYKYGLYYNSERFGPFFVPMFGLYYLSENKKFEANVMLPLQVDLNYKIIPLLNVGVNFNGQGRTYHLSNISPTINSAYVSKTTNELFAYLKFNLGKSLSLQTKVGQSVARSYRVYNDNDKVTLAMPLIFIGDQRKQLNTDFSDGLLFQFVVLYRLDL